MVTIARGPAPPSRAALIGQQAGTGLGAGLIQGLQRQREQEEAARQLEALVAVMSGQGAAPAGTNPLAAAVGEAAPLPAATAAQAGGDPLAAATAQPPVPMPTDGSPMVIPITGQSAAAAPAAQAPAAPVAPAAPGVDPARLQALMQNKDALASLLAGTPPEQMLEAVQTLLQGPPGPEPIKLGANDRLLAPGTFEELVGVVPKPVDPQTELGQLRVALQRGEITPDEFRTLRRQILAGDTPAPRQAARDIDVLLPDGSRMPAVGLDTGSGVLVADARGQFRPLREVFPNATGIAPSTRRTQEVTTPPTPFTAEDFQSNRSFGGIDPTDEAVGPVDRAMSILARVPGVGQTAQALFGDDFGLAERAGNRIFTQLENRIVSAFRPGADNRLSNQEMEMARRLVPSFGAFATEAATTQDLRTLRDMADSLMQQSLRVANQPDRFDATIVRAAQQRLLELGDVMSMIDGLLLARESGAIAAPGRSRDIPSRTEQGRRRAPSLTPQQVQSLPSEQLQQVVDSMSEDDLRQLDDETLRILSERLGGAQ